MESQSETTQTLSALKLPMLKTGDYDLWSMRMEQYLTHTDYALWEVIINGDAPAAVASASASAEGPIPPKTAEQRLARKNELKAKITLLLAIPDEHLLKFHEIKDAKSLWEAIKNRFGGNKESKKMQKTILKQQYENFAASRSEGLDKIYDRFQKLISQLEIHGEEISQEDANLKLLRSLPSAWNNIALIMRNKSDLDTLSMDDLYNHLKVYEAKIKGQSSSTSNPQNVAFVSTDNTSSINEAVNTKESKHGPSDGLGLRYARYGVAIMKYGVDMMKYGIHLKKDVVVYCGVVENDQTTLLSEYINQEVECVFRPRVLNVVAAKSYGTLVVTNHRDDSAYVRRDGVMVSSLETSDLTYHQGKAGTARWVLEVSSSSSVLFVHYRSIEIDTDGPVGLTGGLVLHSGLDLADTTSLERSPSYVLSSLSPNTKGRFVQPAFENRTKMRGLEKSDPQCWFGFRFEFSTSNGDILKEDRDIRTSWHASYLVDGRPLDNVTKPYLRVPGNA
ncbi:hypothetical protein Tco_0320435 [Tanacetum coccineum]